MSKVKTKEDCLNWGGNWIQQRINFSNVMQSLLALFMMGSMEGWLHFMYRVMNYNGEDNAPEYNANENIQIFFVVFFFFGNLIILNSFISISVINFRKLKEKETGEKFISEVERNWLRIKLQILKLVPMRK